MSEATTQRDRLRARALPTRAVHLPADPVAYAAATQELADALVAAQQAGRGPRGKVVQERIAAAQAGLAAQHAETFVLRCLPPPEWEALRALHPPTDDERARGLDWHAATFRPALLAEAVVPPDGEPAFTAEDWIEFARDGRVSSGEQDLLVATAVLLNTRAVQVATGKG